MGQVENLEQVKIQIPFMGFYDTIHDDAIDREIESYFSYDYDTDDEKEMTSDDWDAVWSADVDWAAIRKEYCEKYTDAFGEEFDLTLTFDEMQSPREYNFTTDRIFCKAPREQIDKIRAEVEADPLWKERVKEQFTSYDGFISFYSPDLNDEKWTREIWDECQYDVMLQYWIDAKHRDDPNNNHEWNELEGELVGDFELGSWSSIDKAIATIEKYIKEKNDEKVRSKD